MKYVIHSDGDGKFVALTPIEVLFVVFFNYSSGHQSDKDENGLNYGVFHSE